MITPASQQLLLIRCMVCVNVYKLLLSYMYLILNPWYVTLLGVVIKEEFPQLGST